MALKNAGGLWKRDGGRISGEIEIGDKRVSITLVPNADKTEDRHPDFRLEVGALWKGKAESKAKASGNIEIDRQKIKLFLFSNEDGKAKSERAPDYRIAVEVEDKPADVTDEDVPF